MRLTIKMKMYLSGIITFILLVNHISSQNYVSPTASNVTDKPTAEAHSTSKDHENEVKLSTVSSNNDKIPISKLEVSSSTLAPSVVPNITAVADNINPSVNPANAPVANVTNTSSTTASADPVLPDKGSAEDEHNSSMAIFFVLCVLALGILLIHLMLQTGFQYVPEKSFAFGSLISAVDPVATVAIFHALNVDPILNMLVFGESILNDAIAIVLTTAALESNDPSISTGEAIVLGINRFCLMFFASAGIGVVFALISALLLKHIDLRKNPSLEFGMMLVFTYAPYVLAEGIHLSGIMAILFCGIVMSHYSHFNLSTVTQITMQQTLRTLSFIAETCVFAYLGLALFSFKHRVEPALIIWSVILCLIGRACNIFPLALLVNRFREHQITKKMMFIMWFSGLRGAISYALSLHLNFSDETRHVIITTTLIIVLITTLFFGGSTMPLLKFMQATKNPSRRLRKRKKDREVTLSKTREWGQALDSEHLSETTEGEVEVSFASARIKGFVKYDLKYFIPFFTRRFTQQELKDCKSQMTDLTNQWYQAIRISPMESDEEAVNTPRSSISILVVGAGGIGCEILKNLALSGFKNIEIIDLDTIDVSNLNRQFLFRKEHVGLPKAEVARNTVLNYNPSLNVKAYHDSITTSDYGVNFYKNFDLVLNALDNRTARNHVNRMCLAADVPLIESGTSGYTGQVELIKKGYTQCYECQPKPPQKSFPGCTIRNTPSEPVHCIVWAKHLFNQLFGEADPDQDVSPDTADPELAADAGKLALNADGLEIQRRSTNLWAKEVKYNPEKLFNKFFHDDIKYLLSMENLWKKRKPPKPLTWAEAASHEGDIQEVDAESNPKVEEMQVWNLSKCSKDHKHGMDFVTACANIRAHVFAIDQKSRFEVKSIAGNIVPAIATTNAIAAGLVVLHAFRVLGKEYEKCPPIYIRQKSSSAKTVLMTESMLIKANPNCYVCTDKPSVNVSVNVKKMTVKEFETEVLKNSLNMIAPDALLEGKNMVVISSEEGETDMNNDKTLEQIGILDGSILKVDDFVQNYELTIYITDYVPSDNKQPPFKLDAKSAIYKPIQEINGDDNDVNAKSKKDSDQTNDKIATGSEDDVEVVEAQVAADDPQEGSSAKRRKLNPMEEQDDDLIMLDDDDE
ncbi:Nhe1 [Trypoxylus dichotomus]